MFMKYQKTKPGFTLVELLVIIVIIGILSAVIFVALDPIKRFADARDSRRWQEVKVILDSALKYQLDHDGQLPGPGEITGSPKVIGSPDAQGDCGCLPDQENQPCIDLSDLTGDYLAAIPRDPLTGTDLISRYAISRNQNGQLTVIACDAENTTISITR